MIQRLFKYLRNPFSKKPFISQKQRDFVELVGYITLIHARVEQDLKDHIVFFWGYTETDKVNKLEHSGGQALTKTFIKHIRSLNLPQELMQQYEDIISKFEAISKERNSTLKNRYQYDEHSDEVRSDNVRKQLYESVNIDIGKVDLTPIVNLKEMKEIYLKICKIREAFQILEYKMLAERSKLQDDKEIEGFINLSVNPYKP